MEERHRTCWAVYVLERVMAVSSERCLFMREPLPSDMLPLDEGVRRHRSLAQNVSAPYSDPQCAFARLCQAAQVSGRVIRHVQLAARQKASGQRFDCLEAARLMATAQSLCASLFADLTTTTTKPYWTLVCSKSLTFSAVMTLLRTYSLIGTIPPSPLSTTTATEMLDPARRTTTTEEELSLQINSADRLQSTAAHIAEHTSDLLSLIVTDRGLDKVSPFVLDSIYQSASALSWLNLGGGDLGVPETNA